MSTTDINNPPGFSLKSTTIPFAPSDSISCIATNSSACVSFVKEVTLICAYSSSVIIFDVTLGSLISPLLIITSMSSLSPIL